MLGQGCAFDRLVCRFHNVFRRLGADSGAGTLAGAYMLERLCAPLAVVLLFFGQIGVAMAEGFALYEYSARGVALGGAMVAKKPDASAVVCNPAQITRLKGGHVMAGVSMVSPAGKMKWEQPTAPRAEAR